MKRMMSLVLAIILLGTLVSCNNTPQNSGDIDNNDIVDSNNSEESANSTQGEQQETNDGRTEIDDPTDPTQPATEGLEFTLLENGTYEVSVGTAGDKSEIVIPSVYRGKKVTSIKENAFSYAEKLTCIVIPNGIIRIGDGAFSECYELASAQIPDSVISIGKKAFSSCINLAKINIPADVTYIGEGAFWGTAYYENESNWEDGVLYIDDHLIDAESTLSDAYVIRKGTKTIGEKAFMRCYELTSVSIPDGVLFIGEYAFAYCYNLKEILIEDGVKNIDRYAFLDTAYYNDVNNWNNGVLYICNHLIEADNTISGAYEINANTKAMANGAFAGCKELTSIKLPSNLTYISDEAFYNCQNLTSVLIPNTIIGIGDYAFYRCFDLKELVIPQNVTYIGTDAFWHCESLTSINIPTKTSIIDYGAFSGCLRVESITVSSDNQNYISLDGNLYNKDATILIQYALGKTNDQFEIPTGVTCIGRYAFSYALRLTNISIPNSVEIIGECAFSYCDSLKSIQIPNSVIAIGDGIFNNCRNLKKIEFENPNGLQTDFDYNSEMNDDGIIENNTGSSDTNNNTTNDNSKLAYQINADGMTCTIIGIGESTEENLHIPSRIGNYTVTAIQEGAFNGCAFLKEVSIPASVIEIGGVIFDGCVNLKKIIYQSSYKSALPFYVQYDYELGFKLVDTIEYGYETLHERFFYDAPRFVNLILNENVKTVEAEIFTAADGVENLIISSTVSNIAIDAFSGIKAASIEVDQDNKLYKCENGCLINKKTQEILAETDDNYIQSEDDVIQSSIESYVVYQAELYADWFEDVFVNSSGTYSDMFYSELTENEDFMEKLIAWELAHIAAEPSHTLESGWISLKDVYKLLIYDMLGGSSDSEDLASLYDTVSNDATSYMYKFLRRIASKTVVELDDLMNCDTSAYTSEIKEVFGNIDKLDDILGHFDCLYDAVYTCAQYQAFANMDEAFKNVLTAIYNDTDNPEDLRNAAKECIACYEAGVQNILTQLAMSTFTNEFKSLMGDMMDEVWSKMVYSIPGGIGVFVMEGMRGIHALGDTLCNLDDRNEAFYQLEANVFLETALLNVLPTLYDDFVQTFEEDAATTYMRAIDMYKCVALSGYDYSIRLLEVKATAFGVSEDELIEYNSLIEEIETYKTLKKENFETFENATLEEYLELY